MADEAESTLTKEQKEKAAAWINEKLPAHKCPMCGEDKFQIADQLVVPLNLSNKPDKPGLKFSGGMYPQLMFICTNCGTTQFLNAVILGLVGPPAENSEKEKEAKEQPNG